MILEFILLSLILMKHHVCGNKIKVNIEKRKDAFEYRCGIIKHNGKPCRNKPSHWGKMDHEYKTVPFDYYTWGPCSYHIRRYYMDKNKNIHTLT